MQNVFLFLKEKVDRIVGLGFTLLIAFQGYEGAHAKAAIVCFTMLFFWLYPKGVRSGGPFLVCMVLGAELMAREDAGGIGAVPSVLLLISGAFGLWLTSRNRPG
ncbi:hypothetical protein [Pontibacter sp. G13]|uniref:hypothetical protein n=1 Tax=Pontibacter sp. G13 TaxID=3074898 RepID=UPI00288A897A|nr:hypothetical protein [Pontibacter sp. G13]WNJ17200.1 hypothetical protein RJD25_20280 [Pontibacter sp. G13]